MLTWWIMPDTLPAMARITILNCGDPRCECAMPMPDLDARGKTCWFCDGAKTLLMVAELCHGGDGGYLQEGDTISSHRQHVVRLPLDKQEEVECPCCRGTGVV